MTCDETLWPCWMCRETTVGVEDSARMSGGSGGLDGRLGGYKAARPGVGTSGRAYDHSPAKDK